MQSKIELSIIIPTLGRQKVLLDALNNLSKQNLEQSKWECVIVTQNQFNNEFITKLNEINITNIKVFYSEEPNASLARNIGIKEANGDIVLFLDDDIIIDSKDFLNAHLKNYKENPKLSGVFGQILSTERHIKKQRHKYSFKPNVGWLYFPSNFNKNCKVKNGVSANLSVNKPFAINVGGMDAAYVKGAHREESDFCLRLTKKYGLMMFDVDASLVHIGEPTGGVRSWGKNSGIHPMHHIVGEWYFILNGLFRYKTIKFKDLPHHLLQILWRQVFNRTNMRKVYPVFTAIFKSFVGFIKAIAILGKPSLYSTETKYTVIKI